VKASGSTNGISPANIDAYSTDPSYANAIAVSKASGAGGMGGVAPPPPIYDKYVEMVTDPGVQNHFEPWMTPAEAAVEVLMNPGVAKEYPPITLPALQQAASQLEGLIASGKGTKNGTNPAIQQELNAVLAKIQSMSPSNAYDYGVSLGLSPAQLAAMGFYPNNENPVIRGS
jgi:hypothetical protein